jgi:hypothetical protein
MITLFQTNEHEAKYYEIYDEKINQKCYMLQLLLQTFYNRNNRVDPDTIDGKTLQVLVDLASTLTYETDSDFKDVHPEYQDDIDCMFLTRDKVKETIIDALAEVHKGGEQ